MAAAASAFDLRRSSRTAGRVDRVDAGEGLAEARGGGLGLGASRTVDRVDAGEGLADAGGGGLGLGATPSTPGDATSCTGGCVAARSRSGSAAGFGS